MKKVQLSAKAIEDLDLIWNFTKNNWSLKQADKYYNNLLEEIFNITQSINKSKSYNHIVSGFRAIQSQSHLIFFLQNTFGVIEIRRILQIKMDLESRLK